MEDGASVEPIRGTVAGVELVTIPVWHYAELLECRQKLAEAATAPVRVRQLKVDTRSRLFDDPEVAAFLAELEGTMRLSQARDACAEKFGAARTPSRSTIQRFWRQQRYSR